MAVRGSILLLLAISLQVAEAVQIPIFPQEQAVVHALHPSPASRKLNGRFLHITDIHPDPFYKVHSNSDEGACHHAKGAAGHYGAQKTDCDSPYSLVNATFDWIDENLKDDIDFVVWTGDSARHDNDERIPRSEKQVLDQNTYLVGKMRDVFGKEAGNHRNQFKVPIVPTFGNNDILPHNIFSRGPNKWTTRFARLWKDIIPEEQKHQFERSGWFYVEVIPNKLAVFSLNTMYFFGSNAAVDGCKSRTEPGFEHFEWLRIQLQFLRDRGMKAIISGHVPPARNDQKVQWDESCWQKYALWLRQYRDVVVGSLWGHMNIEHFFLQDFEDIKKKTLRGRDIGDEDSEALRAVGNNVSVQVKPPAYLTSLRDQWTKLPKAPKHSLSFNGEHLSATTRKDRDARLGRWHDEIGGEWAERYSASFVSASVVPNFFPTLRVIEYNTTGLEAGFFDADPKLSSGEDTVLDVYQDEEEDEEDEEEKNGDEEDEEDEEEKDGDEDQDKSGEDDKQLDIAKRRTHKKHGNKKKHHKKKKPARFVVPAPPSKSAPPGPAYSPQTLTWLGYKQYFANLTLINNEGDPDSDVDADEDAKTTKKKGPRPFAFEVEYDTRNNSDVYELAQEGLTVRSLVRLAARIGRYRPDKGDEMRDNDGGEGAVDADKKKKHKHKHHKRRIINRTWYAFVDRAVVRTLSREQLHEQFGQEVDGDDDDE